MPSPPQVSFTLRARSLIRIRAIDMTTVAAIMRSGQEREFFRNPVRRHIKAVSHRAAVAWAIRSTPTRRADIEIHTVTKIRHGARGQYEKTCRNAEGNIGHVIIWASPVRPAGIVSS